MSSPRILVVLLLAVASHTTTTEAATPLGYELEVEVDPNRRQVDVTGRVSVRLTEGETTFSFNLHRTFRIMKCAIDGKPAHCDPREAAPSGAGIDRTVTVQVPDSAIGKEVGLEIHYGGQLWERPNWGEPDAEGPFMDDSAGPGRVELALYSSWYPSFGFGLSYDVMLDVTMPKEWGVVCIGREVSRRETGESTTTRWEAHDVNDVVIIGSPKLRSKDIETAAGRVRIYHTRLSDAFLRKMARETEQTLLLFSRLLGEPPGGGMLQHVYSPRDWGQGFARPGLIVVSEGRVLRALVKNPDVSFLYEDAHETGHFWWKFGSGQGDWINEAFAEYFALVAVQSIQGEAAFQEGLAKRRESVEALPSDAPPIARVPASNDGNGYTIRYHKGSLMLDAFRKHMGDDAFFNACRSFFESFNDASAGTDDFRAHWRSAIQDPALLSSWLNAVGSAPVASSDTN